MKPSEYEMATNVAQEIQRRIDAKASPSEGVGCDQGETKVVAAVPTGSVKTYAQQCQELCWQIERCGSSEELTKASMMAAALLKRLTPKDNPAATIAAVFSPNTKISGDRREERTDVER